MRYLISLASILFFIGCKEKCKIGETHLKIYPLLKENWSKQMISVNKNDTTIRFIADFIIEGEFCDNPDSISKYILCFMDSVGNSLMDSNESANLLDYDFYKTDEKLNRNSANINGRDLDKYYRDECIGGIGYDIKRKKGSIAFEKIGEEYARREITKKRKWELSKIEYY